MKSSLLLCLVCSSLCWFACSATEESPATDEPTPARDSGTTPPVDEPDEETDAGKKDGGAKKDGSADGGDPKIDTTKDSENCGAIGHSCEGAACTASICTPTPLSVVSLNHVVAIAVGGNDLVILEEETPGSTNLKMKKGTSSVGTTLTEVGGPVLTTTSVIHDLRVGGGYVYWIQGVSANGGELRRRPLAGTVAVTDEIVRANVRALAVDDTNVVFTTPTGGAGTYIGTHAAAATLLPSPAGDAWKGVAYANVVGFGNALYAFQDATNIRVVLKIGGASSLAATRPTSVAGTASTALAATTVHLYGLTTTNANPATCEAATLSLWRTTRTGGAPNVLFTGPTRFNSLQGDTRGAAAGLEDCANTVEKVYSWVDNRAGTGPIIAKFQANEAWTVAGDHMYFESGGTLSRVAR